MRADPRCSVQLEYCQIFRKMSQVLNFESLFGNLRGDEGSDEILALHKFERDTSNVTESFRHSQKRSLLQLSPPR